MKAIIETGTDIASLSIFDPASVSEFTNIRRSETAQVIDTLAAAGKLIEIVTGADGAYLFHVFVDEEPNAGMMKHAEDPITVESFAVASGKICVCGSEFVLRLKQLQQNHMGAVVNIPAGTYSMKMYRIEWPDSLIEKEVRKKISKADRKLENVLGPISSICLVGGIVSFLLSFTINWRFTIPAGLGLIGTAMVIWKSGPFRRAMLARQEVEKDFPSAVVVMKKSEIQSHSGDQTRPTEYRWAWN